MLSYQNPVIDEDGTVIPVVTTILPPTTATMGSRSKWIMVAVVAGMLLLVVVGAVVLQDGETAAEGLVVGNPSVMNIVSAA